MLNPDLLFPKDGSGFSILHETSVFNRCFSQTTLSPIIVELRPEISINFNLFSISFIDISLVSIALIIYLLKDKIKQKCHKIGINTHINS